MNYDLNQVGHELATDYDLLILYNPYFIREKIRGSLFDIEVMYDRTIAHAVFNVSMSGQTITYESVPVDRLAIAIAERKKMLNKFIERSREREALLLSVVSHYTDREKRQLKIYWLTNGNCLNTELIERLKAELYQVIKKDKELKEDLFNQERLNHLEQLKSG